MTRRVAFSETDLAGVMHFSNYFRWIEDLEHNFWLSLGLSVVLRLPDGAWLSWPRVAVHCEYKSPARFEDEVGLALRLVEVGEKRVDNEADLSIGERRVAQAWWTAVCCRMKDAEFKAISIPDDIRAKLGPSNTARQIERGT
jgi:YbgC/YbaW family acyl-CoA thioester hydrolase